MIDRSSASSAASRAVEAPSGKGARDENFPVGSILIARHLRPCVMAFYDFARAADDIADSPNLSSPDKLRRLNAFEEALDDPDTDLDKPRRLAQEFKTRGLDLRHARDLLIAFRQDASRTRYETFPELMRYCAYSANPVGRFLLDLHGEAKALWPASDALCTVLQILNHLQDCARDYRDIDRVYVPERWLADEGLTVEVLASTAAPRGLRRVLDRCLGACDGLLERSAELAPSLRDRRLAAEAATIHSLASRLSARLRTHDPLATRVSPSRIDFAASTCIGLARLVRIGPQKSPDREPRT